MSSTKMEFAVQMTCESCVKLVRKSLEGIDGIGNVDINLKTSSVVIDTKLPVDNILKLLESTGKKVALKGYGDLSGVSILDVGNQNIKGVVRFIQQSDDKCIIDGTIDGLLPGKHLLSVHECGDISNGCLSVGGYFNPAHTANGRVYGNLGCINSESTGRATFKFDDPVVKLSDIIGRSLVVSDSTGQNRLACGIIARSAGLFQNPKMICACDGVTIWNEKLNPETGATSSL